MYARHDASDQRTHCKSFCLHLVWCSFGTTSFGEISHWLFACITHSQLQKSEHFPNTGIHTTRIWMGKLQDCLQDKHRLRLYVWQCCCRILNYRGRKAKAQAEKSSRAGSTCTLHAKHLSQTSEEWNLVASFRRSVHMKQVCTWASQLSSMRLGRETTQKRKIYTQKLWTPWLDFHNWIRSALD